MTAPVRNWARDGLLARFHPTDALDLGAGMPYKGGNSEERMMRSGWFRESVARGCLCLALTCVGCGSGVPLNQDAAGPAIDTGQADAGTVADGVGSDTALPDVPACDIEPTLASLQEHYFAKSCSFGSCHGAAAEGGLDLTGDVHSTLIEGFAVNRAAAAAGKRWVVPGDPEASFLLQKVLAPDESEGALMPVGTLEPMDVGCRIEMLRQWILDGAQP